VVLVGAQGTILYSSDRARWERAATSGTGDLYGVTYAQGRSIVVGDGGILTSTDAMTYQEVTSAGALPNFRAVAASRNAVVAVGENGAVWRSLDGISNWQPVALPATHSQMSLKAVAGDQSHSVLWAGGIGPQGQSGLLRSTDDGATWSVVNSNNLVGKEIQAVSLRELTPSAVYVSGRDSATSSLTKGFIALIDSNGNYTDTNANSVADNIRGLETSTQHMFAVGDKGVILKLNNGTLGVISDTQMLSFLDFTAFHMAKRDDRLFLPVLAHIYD
jgi:photosystem II stability/assembly factor-like uncharacterized protein